MRSGASRRGPIWRQVPVYAFGSHVDTATLRGRAAGADHALPQQDGHRPGGRGAASRIAAGALPEG
ncbi:MAG: hypothetical protein R2851_04990 [Caldilineaceae bacterium]